MNLVFWSIIWLILATGKHLLWHTHSMLSTMIYFWCNCTNLLYFLVYLLILACVLITQTTPSSISRDIEGKSSRQQNLWSWTKFCFIFNICTKQLNKWKQNISNTLTSMHAFLHLIHWIKYFINKRGNWSMMLIGGGEWECIDCHYWTVPTHCGLVEGKNTTHNILSHHPWPPKPQNPYQLINKFCHWVCLINFCTSIAFSTKYSSLMS